MISWLAGWVAGQSVFAAAVNPLIKNIKSIEMKGALRTLAGGTASRLGGGKFASGATSAAMGFLFNDVLHEERRQEPAWPTDHKKITSGYSLERVDPVTGQTSRPHTAIDIKNPQGDPVYSVLDGLVSDVGSSSGAGNYIKVDHGNGLETSYSHTSSALTVGEAVTRSQTIGFSDSSGRIKGPHLHFVARQDGIRVDPCTVLSCP